MFLTKNRIYNELFDVFEQSFSNGLHCMKSINYKVDDDNLNVTLDVPGFSKDNLNISAEHNVITIDGECTDRQISKSYKVGSNWDLSKASASVTNGVLDLKIPKFEAKRKKNIEIKVK